MGFFVVLPRSEARKVPAKIPTKLQPRTDEDPTVRWQAKVNERTGSKRTQKINYVAR